MWPHYASCFLGKVFTVHVWLYVDNSSRQQERGLWLCRPVLQGGSVCGQYHFSAYCACAGTLSTPWVALHLYMCARVHAYMFVDGGVLTMRVYKPYSGVAVTSGWLCLAINNWLRNAMWAKGLVVGNDPVSHSMLLGSLLEHMAWE